MSFDNEEKLGDILQLIGLLIVTMQTTERLINKCLVYVFPEDGELTLETLAKGKEKHHKATLGRLVETIQKRVDLDEDFQEVLSAFVNDRNTLIHDLSRMGGLDRRSVASLDQMEAFLNNLYENHVVVGKVFSSLLVEWSKPIGFDPEQLPEISKYLGDVDGVANLVFRPKESR